jgi:hypothetical protein
MWVGRIAATVASATINVAQRGLSGQLGGTNCA